MTALPRWSHQRDGPLFYAHIPRTAGSELSVLLRAMLPTGLSKGQKSSPLDCWPQSPAPLVVYGHTMPPDPGFKCGPKPGGPRYVVGSSNRSVHTPRWQETIIEGEEPTRNQHLRLEKESVYTKSDV